MTQIKETYITFKDSHLVAVCKCDYCGYPNIAMKQRFRYGNMDYDESHFASGNDEQAQYLHWLPDEPLGREFEEVPEHIAAILMARSVLEATAKDKGVEKGNLASKIDALADKGVISPQIKDEAHEIRYLGNDMAHGDFVEPVTEEDADDMLGFLATFLNYVYQMPAAIRKRQDARRKRKGNPNE